MDETANLSLPYIMPQQAQKFVTHNDALRDLDSIVQLSVLDRDLATPPPSPADGDRYLVAASPTDAWAGHDGAVAAWQDGLWLFYAPRPGWRVWVADEAVLITWTGAAWLVTGQSINPAPMVGVVATADTGNRLAVKSNGVLFADDDVTPGTGDMRITVSKAAAANDVCLSLENGFSPRALLGLIGDDNLTIKVSPDGATYYGALTIDNASGHVAMGGAGTPTAQLTINANSAALPAPATGTMLHLGNADAKSSRIVVDAFGDGTVSPNVTFRHARGTAASPSAVQTNDQIMNVAAFGYGATGYSATTRGGFIAWAAENWSDTAQGTYFTIMTTANGTTGAAERLRINNDGSLLMGAGSQMIFNGGGIVCLRSYTVASLPSAATAGQLIYVSNGTSNKRLAVSDGTNWRFPDGAIVS